MPDELARLLAEEKEEGAKEGRPQGEGGLGDVDEDAW